MNNVSNSFMVFVKEGGMAVEAYMEAVRKMDDASALDKKTEELAYIGVLAATRMTSGLAFHVSHAKALGASREEIKSAVLVGLPAVGLTVCDALMIALESYDQ